jgi:hypothetical protein
MSRVLVGVLGIGRIEFEGFVTARCYANSHRELYILGLDRIRC